MPELDRPIVADLVAPASPTCCTPPASRSRPTGPDAGRRRCGWRAPATTNELYWLGRVTLTARPRPRSPRYDAVFASVFRGLTDVADSRGAPERSTVPRPRRSAIATDDGRRAVGHATGGAPRPSPFGDDRWRSATTTASHVRSARPRQRRGRIAPPPRLRRLHAGGTRAPAPRSSRDAGRRRLDVRVAATDATTSVAPSTGAPRCGTPAAPAGSRSSCACAAVTERRRRVVLIADVSGSMEAYCRAYLYLLHGSVERCAPRRSCSRRGSRG